MPQISAGTEEVKKEVVVVYFKTALSPQHSPMQTEKGL